VGWGEGERTPLLLKESAVVCRALQQPHLIFSPVLIPRRHFPNHFDALGKESGLYLRFEKGHVILF
jgi:hypothetical protein